MKGLSTMLITIAIGGTSATALAQSLPLPRPGDERQNVEKELVPKAEPKLNLPPIEKFPEAKPVPGEIAFALKGVVFEGNTVFGSKELTALIANYIGKEITSGKLEKIRLDITRHYINNGYINSGAIIPDQDLDKGILKIQIKMLTEKRQQGS